MDLSTFTWIEHRYGTCTCNPRKLKGLNWTYLFFFYYMYKYNRLDTSSYTFTIISGTIRLLILWLIYFCLQANIYLYWYHWYQKDSWKHVNIAYFSCKKVLLEVKKYEIYILYHFHYECLLGRTFMSQFYSKWNLYILYDCTCVHIFMTIKTSKTFSCLRRWFWCRSFVDLFPPFWWESHNRHWN